jgi:hypothetical protein
MCFDYLDVPVGVGVLASAVAAVCDSVSFVVVYPLAIRGDYVCEDHGGWIICLRGGNEGTN